MSDLVAVPIQSDLEDLQFGQSVSIGKSLPQFFLVLVSFKLPQATIILWLILPIKIQANIQFSIILVCTVIVGSDPAGINCLQILGLLYD